MVHYWRASASNKKDLIQKTTKVTAGGIMLKISQTVEHVPLQGCTVSINGSTLNIVNQEVDIALELTPQQAQQMAQQIQQMPRKAQPEPDQRPFVPPASWSGPGALGQNFDY